MTELIFNPMIWLIAAFALGALELMTGAALIGGLALGALVAAGAVWFAGAVMAESAFGIGWPLIVAAIGALAGTGLMNRLIGRDDSKPDIND